MSSNTKPNIVLIMSDDQGFGDVGYNGHPVIQTPNLDDMEKNSLRLDRFYAAAPVCSPTRASVLTGRHPNRDGVYSWSYALKTSAVTLAEVLKAAGYTTGHFGKWHLGAMNPGSEKSPAAQGFTEYSSTYYHFDFDPALHTDEGYVEFIGEGSSIVADETIDFLNRHYEDDSPFFVTTWFASCHTPYLASDEDRALYADEEETVQNYYGEITAMDRAIGRIRNTLRDLGIHQNTLVIFCSDNGGLEGGISVTGGRGGKHKIYEGGLRVPALIEWPERIPVARSYCLPLVTSDIMPTILDFVGIPCPQNIDGVSFKPVIDNIPFSRKPIGFWYFYPGRVEQYIKNNPEIDDKTGHAAWLMWPWKLHKRNINGNTVFELYNLLSDPYEEVNVIGAHYNRFIDMRNRLWLWQESVVLDMQIVEQVSEY